MPTLELSDALGANGRFLLPGILSARTALPLDKILGPLVF
jgi:hypothetical protein